MEQLWVITIRLSLPIVILFIFGYLIWHKRKAVTTIKRGGSTSEQN